MTSKAAGTAKQCFGQLIYKNGNKRAGCNFGHKQYRGNFRWASTVKIREMEQNYHKILLCNHYLGGVNLINRKFTS